jgi:transmembrane sensor
MGHRTTEALNEEAAAWFARLQRPDLAAEERRAFDAWIDADPARAVAFARVEATWERAARLAAAPPAAARPPVSSGLISRRAAAAALFTVGAGGAALWWAQRDPAYATAVGERRTLVLADGSRVELNTASRLEVAFRRRLREVRLLDGEALFEVAKDAARPFVVHAGGAAVLAVGTAFNVRLRGLAVEVTVTEGVVAVSDPVRAGGAAARVTAGRAAVLRGGAAEVATVDGDDLARRTAWRQGMIELRGETLEQAVAEFNRYRTTKLVVADPRLAAIRVGGAFETDESEKFLAALRSGFGISTREGADGSVHLVSAA